MASQDFFFISGELITKDTIPFIPVSLDVDTDGNVWLAEIDSYNLYVMSCTYKGCTPLQTIQREDHEKIGKDFVNVRIWCTKDGIFVRDAKNRLVLYELVKIWE